MNKNVLVTYRAISIISFILTLGLTVWAFFQMESIFSMANIESESGGFQVFVWLIVFSAFASFFVSWRSLLTITVMTSMQKGEITEDDLTKLKDKETGVSKKVYDWNKVITEDSDKLLHNLCRTLDLDLGRLYRLDKNQDYINISNYAFITEDDSVNKFRKGDGLIGQVATNGKGLHIKDIPNNYLKIVSAGGNISPTNIYILPIVIDNDSKIIFELADMIKNGDDKYDSLKEFANIFANNLNDNK